MKKKSFRDIRNAVFMLCIMLAMLSTATFAWFSMNNRVTANGMKVKAQSSGSLVISKKAPTATADAISVTFEEEATTLVPATHDGDYAEYAQGLKKLDQATSEKISAGTGLITGGSYGYEAASTAGVHYVDYVVYVSTAGSEALANKDLKATISSDAIDATVETDTLKAASIDFYVQTVNSDGDATTIGTTTYKDTLNLAGVDNDRNEKTEVTLLSNTSIPRNVDTNKLRITMRIYFDGALTKSAGQAYVYSNKVNTEALSIEVNFTATDTVTP